VATISGQQLASTATPPANLTQENRAISLSRLWWIYLVIPATFLAMALDATMLDNWTKTTLTKPPDKYFLLALVFGTPHILASNFLLFSNRDYRTHYRRQIIWISAAIVIIGVGLGLSLPRPVMFGLISAWTVAHVVKQQIGIGNIASRLSGVVYKTWSWAGIASGVLFYNVIFQARQLDRWLAEIRLAIGLLSVAIIAMTIALLKQTNSTTGRKWLLSNGATMSLSGLIYLLGYPFFAVLLPRLVHDITAFTIYVNHDANRSRAGLSSWLYAPIAKLPRLQYVVLPLAAVGVAAVLERHSDGVVNGVLQRIGGFELVEPISLGLVGYFGLMHYAFESMTWKGSSPYRSFIRFS